MTERVPEFDSVICKYAQQLPRYTSYPTAVELKPVTSSDAIIDTMRELYTAPATLYVHLPFCPRLCYFCACNKIITSDRSLIALYLSLLEQEAMAVRRSMGRRPQLHGLHLGGGSPSYLYPGELERLYEVLDRHFDLLPGSVKSIEVDPRTMTREKAQILGASGFTRASIGVQDFDPTVQRIINREHSVDAVRAVCDDLREAGVEALNFDLIYGLPGQTFRSFNETLGQVIALRPSRAAVYGYAHVPNKVRVQNVFRKTGIPTPDQRFDLFLVALRAFESAGYEYIGFDHFALPSDELAIAQENGTLRRNFMGYTAAPNSLVLGLGLSALSDSGTVLYQNASDMRTYRDAVLQGSLPIAKALTRTREDRARERLIQQVMCYGQADVGTVPADLFGRADVEKIFLEALDELMSLADDGIVRLDEDGLSVTRPGQLFLRHVAHAFDAYRYHGTTDKPSFSQAL